MTNTESTGFIHKGAQRTVKLRRALNLEWNLNRLTVCEKWEGKVSAMETVVTVCFTVDFNSKLTTTERTGWRKVPLCIVELGLTQVVRRLCSKTHRVGRL